MNKLNLEKQYIVSCNTGGLSNRVRNIVSCIRYAEYTNISYGVYWIVLNKDTNVCHYLNCQFNKLFKNVC